MEIDRIQMVVPEREAAAERWRRLLDAQVVREDEVAALGARHSVLGVGASEVELLERGPEDWTGPRDGERPDNLFLHPRALGGVMLGVSRTTYAWTGSGSPDRVAPLRDPGLPTT